MRLAFSALPAFIAVHRQRVEDGLALLISLAGVIASFLVAKNIFERMPHIEDEVAYVWEARIMAHGDLTIPEPPHPRSFLVPFVVDASGHGSSMVYRSAKYPLGWPVLLSFGVLLGMRAWINPLLAGLAVWLIYRLGKRFFSAAVGLLAAGLTVASPFFLMNSGSLLSHPFGLVLSAAFALAWLDLFYPRPADAQSPNSTQKSKLRQPSSTVLALAAGLSLGMLVLTRPFTALALAVPFGLHGLYLLARGTWAVRRRVLAVGLIGLALSGLYFAWQYAVTGNALKNPYELWWPYDKVGFGKGYGVLKQGHNLPQAEYNTRQSLASGTRDLFGWSARVPIDSDEGSFTLGFSWIFLPFGLWAITFGRRPALRPRQALNRPAWMLVLSATSLVVGYMAYWIGSELYGPRYYYEGVFAVMLISAAGIAFLAGWPVNPGDGLVSGKRLPAGPARLRWMAVALLLAGLLAYNLAAYLPGRLQEMRGLYGLSRQVIDQFLAARVQPAAGDNTAGQPSADAAPALPALIIVHSETWHFYGALIELEDPYLTTPDIFAWSLSPTVDFVLHNDFPNRTVYHYYKDDPGILYTRPKP